MAISVKTLAKGMLELIGLQTARARIIAFIIASCLIAAVPFEWLNDLSLWKRLGWDWAPSIGLTRSYWLILHGDFAAAWERNWLIFLVLAILIPLLGKDIYSIYTNRKKQSEAKPVARTK